MKTKFQFLIATLAVAVAFTSCISRLKPAISKDYVEHANCGLNMKMIYVEGGTFEMGSRIGDLDEMPVHTVTLDSYYIAECEVTQAQWMALMGYNPSKFYGDNNPVENVNWFDAKAFCAALSNATGKRYELPTEAQWEYAARGGKKSQRFAFSGGSIVTQVGWVKENNNARPFPVKQLQPNELGLYDMTGNVLEWCGDYYDKDYYCFGDQTNPTGPSYGTQRVLRGGCWRLTASSCRVAHRRRSTPTNSGPTYGLRVVCLQ